MKILKHIGSNFPERDGGGIIAQRQDGSVWLFHIYEGGIPGDILEVEKFDLGKTERGYRVFVQRLADAMGFCGGDLAVFIEELVDDLGGTKAATRKLASSIDGRAQILVRLGTKGWWPDIDEHPLEASYEYIQQNWIAPSKKQRTFRFGGIRQCG